MHSVNQICSSKDTLESERIQNKPPTKLTIGLGNRLSGVYMQNSTNTTVNRGTTADRGPQGQCIPSVYFSEIREIDNNKKCSSTPPFCCLPCVYFQYSCGPRTHKQRPYIVTSPENTYPRGKHGENKVHRSSACGLYYRKAVIIPAFNRVTMVYPGVFNLTAI